MTAKTPPSKNFRDARDGQFVTERYATQHPATTVGERRTPAPPPPSKPKK